MSIYIPPNQPYFYIIKHTKSGKMYAGYKKTQPNHTTFFTENGYQTSSNKIKNLIELDGLDSFSIIDIILEEEICVPFGWPSVYAYESWFLKSNGCAKSNLWINSHENNSPIGAPDESGKLNEARELGVFKKYGVTNISQLDSVKQSKIDTMIKNFGSLELAMEEKTRKLKSTNLTHHGVEHTWQIPEVKEKQRKTNLEKYGVDNPSKSEEIKEKKRQTSFKNYGVDNYYKSEESKEKTRIRNRIMNSEVRLCPHCGKIGKGVGMSKKHFHNCKEFTGFERIMGPIGKSKDVTCPHCNKTGKARGMIGTHFDNCPTITPKIKMNCPHCGKEGNDNGYFRSFHINKCKLKNN